MDLRRPFLYEIVRYDPKSFFTLEAVCRQFKENLDGDVSYIQYFMEEMFGHTNIRECSFVDCKRILMQRFRMVIKTGVYKMTYNNGFICKYTIYPDGRVSWNHGGAGGMLAWESDGVYTLTGVHSKAKIERITKVDDKSIKVDHY